MKFFKTNTDPVNQQTFQRHIKFALACHFGFVTLFFIFSQFAGSEIFRYGVLASSVIYMMFALFVMNHIHPSRRFKDVYPNEKLNTLVLVGMAFFPFFFIGFMAHLYFKDKSLTPAPKIFTHYGYFALMIMSFVGVSLIHPKVAYWTAGPAVYYVLDLTQATDQLVYLSANPPKTEESIYRSYMKAKTGKVSNTEILLLNAVSIQNLDDRRKLEIADPKLDKDVLSQKYGRMAIHDIADSLVRFEKSKLHFTDYSIVQWVNPSAALEIFMISSVDEMVKEPLTKGMAKVAKDIVVGIEKKVSSVPVEKKAGYQRVLQTAKSDLSKSSNYRSIASEK